MLRKMQTAHQPIQHTESSTLIMITPIMPFYFSATRFVLLLLGRSVCILVISLVRKCVLTNWYPFFSICSIPALSVSLALAFQYRKTTKKKQQQISQPYSSNAQIVLRLLNFCSLIACYSFALFIQLCIYLMKYLGGRERETSECYVCLWKKRGPWFREVVRPRPRDSVNDETKHKEKLSFETIKEKKKTVSTINFDRQLMATNHLFSELPSKYASTFFFFFFFLEAITKCGEMFGKSLISRFFRSIN